MTAYIIFGQHPVVHEASFRAQVTAFRELGPTRFHLASPAFLACYFALLSISIKLLDADKQATLNWTEEQASSVASSYFDAAVACLYRANFLQHGNLHALQAISLLVIGGRDAGSAALIANLLASALSVAQDMNWHRLCPDSEWEKQMQDKPATQRSDALIEREMKKRVVWSLAYSDWFSASYRGSWIISRARIETPLPLNCTDE